MPETDKCGRCVECGCIPRPDIARAKGEEHCRCDSFFNKIYEDFQAMLDQNDKNIEALAKRLTEEER